LCHEWEDLLMTSKQADVETSEEAFKEDLEQVEPLE
jgi:hypothetical protein